MGKNKQIKKSKMSADKLDNLYAVLEGLGKIYSGRLRLSIDDAIEILRLIYDDNLSFEIHYCFILDAIQIRIVKEIHEGQGGSTITKYGNENKGEDIEIPFFDELYKEEFDNYVDMIDWFNYEKDEESKKEWLDDLKTIADDYEDKIKEIREFIKKEEAL